eukprot:3664222-Rhodomonas_salina.1
MSDTGSTCAPTLHACFAFLLRVRDPVLKCMVRQEEQMPEAISSSYSLANADLGRGGTRR